MEHSSSVIIFTIQAIKFLWPRQRFLGSAKEKEKKMKLKAYVQGKKKDARTQGSYKNIWLMINQLNADKCQRSEAGQEIQELRKKPGKKPTWKCPKKWIK